MRTPLQWGAEELEHEIDDADMKTGYGEHVHPARIRIILSQLTGKPLFPS
jgi:hypothetical protein